MGGHYSYLQTPFTGRPMTRHNLITEIEDILQVDEGTLDDQAKLCELEDWDSLAFISIIALFDKKLHQKAQIDELKKCQTIGDIVTLAGL